QSLDHADEPARLAMNDLRDMRDRVTAGLALDDRLGEPLDRRERRAQLMRDVGKERLLAPASALYLARHLVERGAHLRDLARSRERDAGAVVTAGETPDPADQLAKWPRDRPCEQRRDEDREAERDETAEREGRQKRAQRVGEDRARECDNDEAEPDTARCGLSELLT